MAFSYKYTSLNPQQRNYARYIGLGAAIVVGFLILGQLIYVGNIRTQVTAPMTAFREYWGSARCPSRCPSDPFVQPGMLHWSKKGLANETRWLPFPQKEYDWEAMPASKDLPTTNLIVPEQWALAPPQYTAETEQGKHYDFMRNRTILFVGSSHDRNNVEQFCDVIGGKRQSWGGHTGGFCHHEELDLVILNWFLFGMIDIEDGDWPPNEAKPYTFERRFDEIMVPKTKEAGFGDRKIDLAVVSSLFWDAGFLESQTKALGKDRGESHGYFWNEIAWHRGRVRKMIQKVRELYGERVPMMFRTRQLRAEQRWWGLLKIFQIDQGCRAIAKELGVRLFTWGGKLEGYNVYYDNDAHFALGPNTYLFGDMVLFYLHRSVTKGCWACHQWDD